MKLFNGNKAALAGLERAGDKPWPLSG